MAHQSVRCLKCGRHFEVMVPDAIVGVRFSRREDERPSATDCYETDGKIKSKGDALSSGEPLFVLCGLFGYPVASSGL